MGKLKEGERRWLSSSKVHKFRKASLAMSSQWPRCRVGGGERVCGSPLLMYASTAAGAAVCVVSARRLKRKKKYPKNSCEVASSS